LIAKWVFFTETRCFLDQKPFSFVLPSWKLPLIEPFTMKAIYFSQYGPPEDLQMREIEMPTPKDNEVLIAVKATTINDFDWSLVRGKPRLYRLMFGLRRPKLKMRIPGMEVAGEVVEVGSKATQFSVGDRVYGDTSDYGFGSFAEYFAINEKALTKMSAKMSFEEAAALPHASLLALQGLHRIANLKEGQKVLVNGAGGGVGSFALQLAKLKNCEVTGVDTGEKLETFKRFGFDHVIDYTQEDFTKNGKKYDVVLDCKSNRSAKAYLRSLTSNGIYVTVGGQLSKLAQIHFLGRFFAAGSKKRVKVLALKSNKGLDEINTLFEQGKLVCLIDGPYPLADAGKQIRRFGEGKHTGKVVLKVNQ
jgi:NADPH:quinone reductase-like Zn-dependent oxidoreductase